MIGSLAFDGTAGNASFMLHHFWLLYAGVILFSPAELIVDAMLTAGALTRVAALMFGWLGATCSSASTATSEPVACCAS
jgi:thiosulfate dehydrogenase [quinone] large subunit